MDPPNCVAWHLCVLNRREQKRLSSWHNHCFLSHKEQNLQVRGERKKKKKKIYFCTKVILSLACVLLFCGLSYMEKLTRRGKRQSRFTVREVELLAPWLPSPFLCHFQPVAAGRECLFCYFCLFFKKKGDTEFLSFVLCGLFSNVLSWTEKKKSY